MKRISIIIILILSFLQIHAYNQSNVSIYVNGVQRNMIVFTPNGVSSGLPLLIVTHGMNQSPQYQYENDHLYELIDTERFIIAYLASNGNTWDTSGSGDLDFVDAAINKMDELYSINRNRLYWSGFSMGSMLIYHGIRSEIGKKFAAFAPTSGILFGAEPWNERTTPVNLIHCHSYDDGTFVYDGLDWRYTYTIRDYVTHFATLNNASTYTKTENYVPNASEMGYIYGDKEVWTNGTNGSEVELFSAHGGGHWPTLAYKYEIWNFLKRFSLDGSTTGNNVATFSYDSSTGRCVVSLSDLVAGGNLQFDSSTGVVTLPAGKSGTLTLTYNGADFSNVSKVKLSHTGDDLFNTLTVTNTSGESVNGGAFWSSKYELNYTNYQNNGNVSTLVWSGNNDGSSAKTMTIRQLLIQVDVMRAEQKHEQSLSRWSFGVWDGIGANATRTGDDDDMEYNIDEVISGYGTIYGNGSVLASHYVDLSAYSRLRVYGDNGLSVRALFNRSTDTSSDYVEKSGTITNGVFEVNLSEVGAYAHMNALKVNGGTGSAWRVIVVDDSDPMDYRLSGKLYVADNLSAALSDGNATNYDATELRNSSAVALTPSNRNALFYVDNASRLSNSSNVVVKSGSSYSSGSIVLTDPASAAGDIAGAYFPGGSVKSGNATWSDSGNGAYSFHWSAGTAAEVQIFNYILERQGYKRLVVETTSFTKPWGIRFYDVDGNVITSQGYWAGQHDGNRIKDIDIDSLFAANNVSSKRSTLTMVRLYNISDEEGEVVLKSAYLCNHLSECNYPFYAPYDITASSATLNSYVPDAGFTTVTVPFSASVPSGHSAYALSTSGATSVSSVEANRPVLLTGSGEAVFSASNVVVKATDGLTSGTLQGTYRQLTPSVGYAQRDDSPANVESFTPVDGVTLYAVTASSSVILYPFRAYATDAVVVDPIDPIDPIEITVTSAGVATAYLPYDALVPDVDFFVVAAVKEVSGSTAYLKEVRGEIIPANTGVMIFANPGTYTFTPSPTDCTENVESLLHGVTENTSVQTLVQREGKSIYVLSRGIKEYTGFKVAGGTVKTIGAYKAYLPVDESIETLTKFISISFGGDNALDIDLLKSDTHEQTGGIFDVTGRRVMTPEKGIYIVNGKKVLYK